MGVLSALISQMSVVALGAAGADAVALADGLGDDPTPS
jgi:hypothetical protein